MERSSPGGGGVWSAFSNPVRVSLHFSSSRGIQLDLSRPHPLHEKFSPSRGILIGIPRDQEIFSWVGWGMVSKCYPTRCLPHPTLTARASPDLVGLEIDLGYLYPIPSARTSPDLVGFDSFPTPHPSHENISWSRGIGYIFQRPLPHPLRENISWSRGINSFSHTPPSPREHLLISWDLWYVSTPLPHPLRENISWSRGIRFVFPHPTLPTRTSPDLVGFVIRF